MNNVQSPSLLPTHNTAAGTLQGLPDPILLQNMPAPRPSAGPTTNASNEPPYKAQGYQEFSKWMASENDFFVFRRFESLNAGTILWMQYRISELEKRLEQIHKDVETSEKADNLKNSSFKWDEKWRPERTMIMGELSGLLLQYSEYMLYTEWQMLTHDRSIHRSVLQNTSSTTSRRPTSPKCIQLAQAQSDQ
jgi:hypothetical protein